VNNVIGLRPALASLRDRVPTRAADEFRSRVAAGGMISTHDGRSALRHRRSRVSHPSRSPLLRAQMGGSYRTSDGRGAHGYVHRGDAFGSIDFPDAEDTESFGINDRGEIVGFAERDGFFSRAYVVTGVELSIVSEPSTLALICIALLALPCTVLGWRAAWVDEFD
jgi:hypothetical protein